MFVGIHPSKGHDSFGFDCRRFTDILEYNSIPYEILFAGDLLFWKNAAKCSLFIFQWTQHDYYRQIASSILPVLESELGMRCFPNHLSCWIYDDKIRQYYLLLNRGFSVPKTWIFYDRRRALRFLEKADYPLVFKLKSGAGSLMVKLLKDKSMARRYVNVMFKHGISYKKGLPGTFLEQARQDGLHRILRKKLGKLKMRLVQGGAFIEEDWSTHKNYILLQQFLPDNPYDTRVAVIGNRAFAFQRMNRPKDFRASGSKLHVLEPEKIDRRFVEVAFQVSKTFSFDCMSYDFLYDEDRNPVIVEMSYVFGSKFGSKVSECPGYWDSEMNWHEKQMSAPYCILSQLLSMPYLKNPEST
jgi:hypothetical protein